MFTFRDPSEYADSGENLGKSFWMQDKQLRVYGVVRPNNAGAEDQSQESMMKQFTALTLQQ